MRSNAGSTRRQSNREPIWRPHPADELTKTSGARAGSRKVAAGKAQEKGGEVRASSSDRSAMIEVFSQRFPGLSKRELGSVKARPRVLVGEGRVSFRDSLFLQC